MKKMKWAGFVVVILIVAGAGIWVALVKFEWEKPTVQLLTDSQYVGQNLTFRVEDQKSGVAEVQAEVIQQGKTTALLLEHFPKGTHRVEKTLTIRPLPPGLKNGEARVRIVALDHSWNRGNPVSLEKSVIIDTIPPQVTVLGALHYVNQGGTGLVTYQTSEDTPVNGVRVGDVFYPGYAASQNHYLAYFAVPYNAPTDAQATVMAEDRAGKIRRPPSARSSSGKVSSMTKFRSRTPF